MSTKRIVGMMTLRVEAPLDTRRGSRGYPSTRVEEHRRRAPLLAPVLAASSEFDGQRDRLAALGAVYGLEVPPVWKSTTETGAHEVFSSGSTSAA